VPRLEPGALAAHLDRLYRAAWALCGSREDAEDLVQETFVRVLARPRVLRGEDELAYLMGALRNTFLTARREAARRPHASVPIEAVELADPSAAARPELALEAQEIYAAIAALPEDFRLAIVAVDVVGLSYRSAANVLHTQEATITSRLYRARQQVARAVSADTADLAPSHGREGKHAKRRLPK
jgi:RNA polymerase sigma-70 factor (ECF subfamily)